MAAVAASSAQSSWYRVYQEEEGASKSRNKERWFRANVAMVIAEPCQTSSSFKGCMYAETKSVVKKVRPPVRVLV